MSYYSTITDSQQNNTHNIKAHNIATPNTIKNPNIPLQYKTIIEQHQPFNTQDIAAFMNETEELIGEHIITHFLQTIYNYEETANKNFQDYIILNNYFLKQLAHCFNRLEASQITIRPHIENKNISYNFSNIGAQHTIFEPYPSQDDFEHETNIPSLDITNISLEPNFKLENYKTTIGQIAQKIYQQVKLANGNNLEHTINAQRIQHSFLFSSYLLYFINLEKNDSNNQEYYINGLHHHDFSSNMRNNKNYTYKLSIKQ